MGVSLGAMALVIGLVLGLGLLASGRPNDAPSVDAGDPTSDPFDDPTTDPVDDPTTDPVEEPTDPIDDPTVDTGSLGPDDYYIVENVVVSTPPGLTVADSGDGWVTFTDGEYSVVTAQGFYSTSSSADVADDWSTSLLAETPEGSTTISALDAAEGYNASELVFTVTLTDSSGSYVSTFDAIVYQRNADGLTLILAASFIEGYESDGFHDSVGVLMSDLFGDF